jgi:hypothetical protein
MNNTGSRLFRTTALVLMLMLGVATSTSGQAPGNAAPVRPQGPCDIYAAANAPCVTAHSTTRALYASYNGPLYQVLRQSDGRTLDIGVVPSRAAPVPDAGGYANAAAQDAFCANTYCWISILYDQSPRRNHLVQSPRGGFSGPSMGGFNNLPLAHMAPVTVMGHKVYGVFIEPGMGLRQNDARGTAVDDQAEGQYWVINGHHYNSGCCFDYGNAETDSRDDGNGTMETTYYGNAYSWYTGVAPGPWIMTDQENNLVGCVNQDASKYCASLPTITWRFVTAMAKGEPHHWTSLGGDAQRGRLAVMFDGPRIDASYDPMRKQGAVVLGNGGDNSVGSQGTFYEGAMTAPGTFPSDATDQLIQANVVAARYDVAALAIAPAAMTVAPPGLQTFSPGASQETSVTFTNTTGAPVSGVTLSMVVPQRWTAVVASTGKPTMSIAGPVAPGASASAIFRITSGAAAFNGDMTARAAWKKADGSTRQETAVQKIRNASLVRINEFRVNAGSPVNQTDSFIELYNAGATAVDISSWTLTHHATEKAIFSAVKIPAGTKLAPKGFYLLGLANSGLASAAMAGDTRLHVRNVAGLSAGNTVEIDTGASTETRKIMTVGTAATNSTTLWQPLPDGPVITIPVGSTSVPVTSITGFAVGERIAIGYGATYPTVGHAMERYEVATVTAVGKPGTQAWLTAEAKRGDTNIKVSSVANISAGDQIRLDIDSEGHGIETVTVARVGTQSARNAFNGPLQESQLGTGLELTAPLKFTHSSNMPFSARGTGITFTPATKFAHSSNEPVQALGTGITVDKPLAKAHAIDAVVRYAGSTLAGYTGTPAPNQWFGGPALSPSAGSMVLRDAQSLVVDSLNYGLLVDPWAAEGYQGTSGRMQPGCRVTAPAQQAAGGFPGAPVPVVNAPHRSAGRFPDGFDSDSNCGDFLLQPATVLSVDSTAGSNNIKVASLVDFKAGQTLTIDAGTNLETAVIAAVGTTGATTARTATAAGATVIAVASTAGFSVGQPIVVGSGANQETASVAAVAGGGRGGGNASITVAAPLRNAVAQGAQVAGTGVTLNAPLARAHASGAQVNSSVPTPGGPNRYEKPTP